MPTSRKSKQFSVGVYNNKHLRNLSARLRKVQTLIDEAANKATRIAVRTGYKDTSKDFQFDDFPQARREIDTLLGELSTSLSVNVREASSEAWGTANAKNDAMVDYMLSSAGSKLGKRATQKWYNKNARALNAFLHRREEGMGLSSNVWRLDEFKTELELALELGLGRGKSAAELSRDVRSYLKHPDKLFRRVRDEKGVLRLSRAAEAFHPGQGVYRSSYKNALRLTATETNMAYRTADSKRWQQIDFVIGITIKVSQTNHTVVDICDELQGDYPKDFVFTGWHPFCKCYATSKLASPEEFLKYQQAILDGEDVSDWKFSGEVKDVPGNFKEWLEDNEERIKQAKTLPYFIKDNLEYTNLKPNSTVVVADARHTARTQEEIDRIRYQWNNRRINNMYDAVTNGTLPAGVADTLAYLRDSNELYDFDEVTRKLNTLQTAARRHASRTAADIRRIQDLADVHTYGQAYVDNVHKIEKALGMQRGKRMTHEDADLGKVNPNFGKPGYNTNCSTCSGTYILRRMGFNVEAKANIKSNAHVVDLSLGVTAWNKWLGGVLNFNKTTDWMSKHFVKEMDKKAYMKFIDEYTKKPGIYEFNVGYKGTGGHSTLLERRKDGTIVRIEQQVIRSYSTLDSLLSSLTGSPASVRGIMRVDNAMFNPRFADIVKKVKPKK